MAAPLPLLLMEWRKALFFLRLKSPSFVFPPLAEESSGSCSEGEESWNALLWNAQRQEQEQKDAYGAQRGQESQEIEALVWGPIDQTGTFLINIYFNDPVIVMTCFKLSWYLPFLMESDLG